MHSPPSLTIAISIATFVVALFEYYRVDPEKRVLNRYFGLAAGAIAMAVVNIFLNEPALSGWLLTLAIGWFGLTLYQLRTLPQRPEEKP